MQGLNFDHQFHFLMMGHACSDRKFIEHKYLFLNMMSFIMALNSVTNIIPKYYRVKIPDQDPADIFQAKKIWVRLFGLMAYQPLMVINSKAC